MVCKNGDIYVFLGAWWVLINMVPCNIILYTNVLLVRLPSALCGR